MHRHHPPFWGKNVEIIYGKTINEIPTKLRHDLTHLQNTRLVVGNPFRFVSGLETRKNTWVYNQHQSTSVRNMLDLLLHVGEIRWNWSRGVFQLWTWDCMSPARQLHESSKETLFKSSQTQIVLGVVAVWMPARVRFFDKFDRKFQPEGRFLTILMSELWCLLAKVRYWLFCLWVHTGDFDLC